MAAMVLTFGAPGFADAAGRTAELTRTVYRIDDGAVWGHIGSLVNCDEERETLRWNQETSEVGVKRLAAAFDQVMARVSGGPRKVENLFEEQAAAELQVAAAITGLRADLCDMPGQLGLKGTIAMTVEWQVFDPVERKILARIETHATSQVTDIASDGFETLLYAAFRGNARDLASDSVFQRILKAPSPAGDVRRAAGTGAIRFAGARPGLVRPLPAAAKSVVLVLTGDGHGSGFLISDDGYVLTNQHVVGGSRTVRIRWADGTESAATVLRSDKARDIALLKSEAHGGAPLALHRELPSQGDTVFAVGAPLDPRLQGTMTRGIVSATREIDGMEFIQSDVTVNHGNSGGPLLNERGEVVGVTDLSFQSGGAPLGINLFIPIGDALRVLALQPQADQAAARAANAPAGRLSRHR